MTRQQATKAAAVEAARLALPALCIVAEGPHADDHAEFDPDGESYGFCEDQNQRSLPDRPQTLPPHIGRIVVTRKGPKRYFLARPDRSLEPTDPAKWSQPN